MANQAQLWEVRKIGKPPSFDSPDEMWERAIEYFEWCKENSLNEQKLFNYQGELTAGVVPHMRAMTQAGLCAFMNISVSTWHNYKDKPAYLEVTRAIEEIMTEQKFTGAAAGMLNPNIIARDLGLTEKTEETKKVTHNIMPVPQAASADEWEQAAKSQQSEMLSKHD